MGWIVQTQTGKYRVNWRDPTGRQRAKTLRTKRDARAFLAQVDADTVRGSYVDPHAGRRVLLADYAKEWLSGRTVEARTQETTLAMLRTHVLPRWGAWPLATIDHLSIQQWVAELASRRKPATVAAAVGVLSMILTSAVRSRLIASNPCQGLRLPARRAAAAPIQTITLEELREALLPVTPTRYRALLSLAAGAGLRWGECTGLAWASVDLVAAEVVVRRVAVETAACVTLRPYPKSRTGFRRVPLPGFALDALRDHSRDHAHPSSDLVFAVRGGGPLRRSTFRRRVWVPAVAEAGLSPSVRFHDLRHSYATWLISAGMPINVVQVLMGHEQGSTTLNRYVHAPRDYDDRVRGTFGDAWS